MKEKKSHGGLIFLLILLALIGFGVYTFYPAYKVIRECADLIDTVYEIEYDVERSENEIAVLKKLQDNIDHGRIKGRTANGIIAGEAYLSEGSDAAMEFIRTNRQTYFNLSYLGANALRSINILNLDAVTKWADELKGYYITADQLKSVLDSTNQAVLGLKISALTDTTTEFPDYTLPLRYIKGHIIGMLPCMNPPMYAVDKGISDDLYFFQHINKDTGEQDFVIGVPKKLTDERMVYFFYNYGGQQLYMTLYYTPQEKAEAIEVPTDNAIVSDKLIDALELILNVLSLH